MSGKAGILTGIYRIYRMKFSVELLVWQKKAKRAFHLNESAGFVHIGLMREVGMKFGRRLGVHILQKMLNE
jgi:hypothetical protein